MSATPRLHSWSALFILIALALVPLVLFFAPTSPALAADTHLAPPGAPPNHKPNSIFITNNNDSGPGSLRKVIATAAAFDNIFFASVVSGTITLTTGPLMIAQSLNLIGPGESVLAISGNYSDTVLMISGDSSGSVNLSGLTIKHGLSQNFGAGVYIAPGPHASLTNMSIVSNVISTTSTSVCVSFFCGGAGLTALFSTTVDLNNVTVAGNQAFCHATCTGAGILNLSPLMNLNNVTIANNTLNGSSSCSSCFTAIGGGLANFDFSAYASFFGITLDLGSPTVNMKNVALSGNSVSGSNCSGCGGAAW